MKSNVKREADHIYYYFSDRGEILETEECFYTEDDYRHSVGNYFANEEDVKPCAFCNEEIEEEKFVQMFLDREIDISGLTNKGRIFYHDGSKWKLDPKGLPDFKNIK